MVCVRIKEEPGSDMNTSKFFGEDVKLRKIQEHLIQLKDEKSRVNELHYFSKIFQLIEQALNYQTVDSKSLEGLRTINKNIDVNDLK